MRLTWPLLGRSDELLAIRAAIAAPEVGGIVVAGATGVGKSRIAREALSAAASRGAETRWTVGSSSAQAIPLGAFAAWVPSGATDAVQLLRGVVEALGASATGAPVVVGVDDAHLLDDLSSFAVHQLLQRRLAKVVLTVRDGAPIPIAVQELWNIVPLEWLEVQPLARDDLGALLSAALGGSVTAEASERLWTLTRGNVLYLRNIVEQEVADGRMAQHHGWWGWSGEPVLPPGLAELIESRIGELSGPVSDVLDLLAIGEPLELAVLTELTAAAAVEQAETLNLIALEPVDDGIEVRVAHPLYGEVRRRRAARTRLRRLRGRVATALAASGDRDDVRIVVRRASLALESDLAPDADLLAKAAHGAVWLADLPLADRLAGAAVRAGAGAQPNFVRAHALSWLGRGEEAEAVLAGIGGNDLSDEDRAKLAFLRASNLLWALGDPVRAKECIDAASAVIPAGARARIDAFLTIYWFAMDRPDEATRASKDLVLQDIPVVGAELSWVLAQLAAEAGRTTEAIEVAAAGYEVATRALDAPHMRFNIGDAELSALLLAGRIREARDVAERTRAQAAELPGAARLLGAAVWGRAALGAGDVQQAAPLLQWAADGLSASHAAGWGYRYRVAQVTAHAMGGASLEASTALRALDGVQRTFRSLDFERGLARAWVAANQGATSEAVAVLSNVAETSRRAGRFAEEVMCLQTATQFGDRTGAPRLRELEAIVEGPRVGLAARFAAALRAGDGRELASLSEGFERIGDVVAAVDSAAWAAVAFRRQDKRGSALGCSTRAEALAAARGIVTPALRQASEGLPLTDRETEIVMLIGEGLSNRAVAERLTLSVRTVESHVYRAMTKTGTSTREELGALLRGPRSVGDGRGQ